MLVLTNQLEWRTFNKSLIIRIALILKSVCCTILNHNLKGIGNVGSDLLAERATLLDVEIDKCTTIVVGEN